MAALDLGSNSFHLLVADVAKGPRITRVRTAKTTLRLGEPVAATGRLGHDTLDRALATIDDLLGVARSEGADEVVAVATDAIRHAEDGPELVARVAEAHGVTIQVVDGMDEGALSLIAMRVALGTPFDEGLVALDLGGGSFEVVHATGDGEVTGGSLPIGGARIRSRLRFDPPRLGERVALFTEVMGHLSGPVDAIRAARRGAGLSWPPPVAGTAGTIRDLGRLGIAQSTGSAPERVRGLVVSREQLERAGAQLCAVPLTERADLPGVSAKRADLLAGGATVLLATMEALGSEHLTLCDWGLREGALLDALGPGRIVVRSGTAAAG